jgi:Ca2+-binding RTX toxin-like protein
MSGTAPRDVQRDTHLGIEDVDGSRNDDAIRGNGGANTIRGGYGDDRLYGEAGNDVLDGGDGDNRLYAGAGRDVVGGSFGAEADYTGGDDLIDLGDDSDPGRAVFYQTSDAPSGSENRFIGSDVVFSFDTARDTLEIQNWESYDIFYVTDVRDFLDSNDDGRVSAADQEVARSGHDLVLDLGAVFQRAAEVREPGSDPFRSDASVTLKGAGGGFAAGRVAAPDLDVTYFETIVREDGEFPL